MRNFLASISGNYDDLFLRLHGIHTERDKSICTFNDPISWTSISICNLPRLQLWSLRFSARFGITWAARERYQVRNLIIASTHIASLSIRCNERAAVGNVICVYVLWLWLQMAIYSRCVYFFSVLHFNFATFEMQLVVEAIFCVIEIAFVTLTARPRAHAPKTVIKLLIDWKMQ